MKKTNLKTKPRPKKHPKVKTLRQHLKDTAAIFSKYVRLRDSEPNKNGEWWGDCISCTKSYLVYDGKWNRQVNAGHFVSRTQQIITFDEENVNLQCLTAESRLKMFNGTTKSISEIKLGDELWAFNEHSYDLERAVVENVDSFIPDELYEVELEDGSRFYATPDHRVVANGEWTYIKDILHNTSTYDILEL